MVDMSSFETASRMPFWRETVLEEESCPALSSDQRCDLAIVGGGFSGLWTALKARERFPDARIILLEAGTLGNAASGRNGGFCAPSISHGVSNALARWPNEAGELVRLGRQNSEELQEDLSRYGIEAEFERSGKLNVAAQPWEVEGLRTTKEAFSHFGIETEFLEGAALKEKLDSPRYSAGLFEPNYALVNPAKLVDGLARVCRSQGVEIFENSAVLDLRQRDNAVALQTAQGTVHADKVTLATNAAVPLLRRLRNTIIPIFDYTLMTEPLSDEQLKATGWVGRYGIADSGNQFHYSRKTADNRILWGGYDAIYHFGSKRDADLHHRPESYARLAENFRQVFPALADVTFTHAWGGIIDTSARLTFFTGTAMQGRVAYALGFTGQGVSATRFGALTMLDLLERKKTERTRLQMTSKRAFPFPPEPFRALAVSRAQADLAREDATGKRSGFLKLLDAFGVGFGS